MAEYIDREKLLRDIDHYHLSDGKFQHWVEIQLAADVAPVVHGEWIQIDEGAGAECSNCGEYYDSSGECDLMEGFRLFAKFYRHCPHCGSKMDGEVPNEKPQG